MTNHNERVLAVHPTPSGFGWVVFEGPERPVDWGAAVISGDKNAVSLRRVAVLIDRWQPAWVVMESLEGPRSRHSTRVQELGRGIVELAQKNGVACRLYPCEDIKSWYKRFDARTRHEVAQAVAARVTTLAHELPPKRKIWLSENPRLGIFNAAAVALVHYASNTVR